MIKGTLHREDRHPKQFTMKTKFPRTKVKGKFITWVFDNTIYIVNNTHVELCDS